MRKAEIDEAINGKDYDLAVKLLCESRELDKGKYPGLACRYCEELIRIFDITGKKNEYKRELTDYMLGNRQDNLNYVYLLKNITPNRYKTYMSR